MKRMFRITPARKDYISVLYLVLANRADRAGLTVDRVRSSIINGVLYTSIIICIAFANLAAEVWSVTVDLLHVLLACSVYGSAGRLDRGSV